MVWTINYTATARKQLQKLDRQTARRIDRYLLERVAILDEPRNLGKALSGPLGSFWRYRVGHYRVIADIQDDQVIVLVIRIGHRRKVYQ